VDERNETKSFFYGKSTLMIVHAI